MPRTTRKNYVETHAFDDRVMWNARVHAGVIAAFSRISDSTGLPMNDLLTLAAATLEEIPELKALMHARQRASDAVTQEAGVQAVLDRYRSKARRRHK